MEKNSYNYNRNFTLLLYEEDKTHTEALNKIKQRYDYASILHDKDITEDGEIKKEHIHCVIRVGNNPRWKSAVAKELGIKENYIEGCNLDKQLRYLIHFDNKQKYQYNIEKVEGTLKKRLKEIINKEGKTECEKITTIINYIESREERIDITSFSIWCAENGYWDVFRRASQIIIKIIDNKKVNIILHNTHLIIYLLFANFSNSSTLALTLSS